MKCRQQQEGAGTVRLQLQCQQPLGWRGLRQSTYRLHPVFGADCIYCRNQAVRDAGIRHDLQQQQPVMLACVREFPVWKLRYRGGRLGLQFNTGGSPARGEPPHRSKQSQGQAAAPAAPRCRPPPCRATWRARQRRRRSKGAAGGSPSTFPHS